MSSALALLLLAGSVLAEDAASAAQHSIDDLLAPAPRQLDLSLKPGWQSTPVTSDEALAPAADGRPHRQLDPASLECPPGTQRHSDRQPGEYTITWCATPDGRKKGPELLVHSVHGRRMYTEFLLDQAHGEHVITEADGRVMVRGRYEVGRKVGLWESWYIGGDQASRGTYTADDKTGIWTEWSHDGTEKRCDYRDPETPDEQCVAPED